MTFDKKTIYNYLDGHGINYETTEHKAVSNMEELADIQLPYPENIAKNRGSRNLVGDLFLY